MKLRLLIVSMLIFAGSVHAMESSESVKNSDSTDVENLSNEILRQLNGMAFEEQLKGIYGWFVNKTQFAVFLAAVSSKHFVDEFVASLESADPEQEVKNKALLDAIKGNHHWVVSILFKFGVKIEELHRKDQVSLYKAIGKGDVEILKKLIENGLDVNVQDNDGKTILHYAVVEGNKDVITMLIHNGASFRIKDKQEKSVLDYAYETKNTELVTLFYSYNFPSSIQFLEIPKKNIDILDKNGKAVLHHAILQKNKDFITWLIGQGANINSQNKYGKTVLHDAVIAGDKDLEKLLITHGAKVNAKDKDGKTVLHHAVIQDKNNDFIKWLIAHGAKVNAKDKDGKTAFFYATENGNTDVATILLNMMK